MIRRARTPALSVAAFGLVALCAACGSGSSGSGVAAGAATSTVATTPSPAPSPSPSSNAAAEPAADGNPLKAEDFCAFLTGDAPKIAAAGSPEGALAQIGGDLAFWVESHPQQKPRTAADLDEAAAAACPDVAKTVLTALEAQSFMDAFN